MRAVRRRAAALVLALATLLAAGTTAGATGPYPGPHPGTDAGTDRLAGPGVVVDPLAPAPPPITATSWLVADLDTGEVLAAQNARLPLAPASTLKLLTLLALAPGLDRDAEYTGTHEAAAVEGSKVGVVPGSVYTVDDLVHGLMLASGNDAAGALAELSGGMTAAAARMTGAARDLGADDTRAANASGLDAPGQVSTAYDLALIGRAVLADPELAAVVQTRTYDFPGAGTTWGPERPRFQIANHNRLLTTYQGALGLKNGYTDAARGSFVGAVERDGRRYVVTLMAAEGKTWQLARSLLDWALATGTSAQAVGSLAPEPLATGSAAPAAVVADGAGLAALAAGADGAGGAGAPGWLVGTAGVLAALALTVAGLRVTAVRRLRRRRVTRRTATGG